MERIVAMSGPEQVRLRAADGIVLVADYYERVTGGGPAGTVAEAPAYLLGHGFTGSSRRPHVQAIARRLQQRGATVLVLNFRGHGPSQGRSSIGVSEVADVAAGLQWLRARRPDAPLVSLGFSMGASIVVRHAGLQADPDAGPGGELAASPDAVVAVSGPGRWYERGTQPMRRLHLAVETRLGRQVLRRMFNTRVVDRWELLPVSPVEVASAITAPLLVVHGDQDDYFPLAHPRMLAAAAPRSCLWIEAGMGHGEHATSVELVDRIDAWARSELGASATMDR